ncbi:MAG: hypothetical protein ACTSYA_10825 [Candidatus Kariarchaeaceae archaeon]
MIKKVNEVEIAHEDDVESKETSSEENKVKKDVYKIEVNKQITSLELYYFKMK